MWLGQERENTCSTGYYKCWSLAMERFRRGPQGTPQQMWSITITSQGRGRGQCPLPRKNQTRHPQGSGTWYAPSATRTCYPQSPLVTEQVATFQRNYRESYRKNWIFVEISVLGTLISKSVFQKMSVSSAGETRQL